MRALAAGTVVVLAGLAVAGIVLARMSHDASSRNSRRAAALSTARVMAAALTSIDYRTASADLRRIVDGTTGDAHRLFSARLRSFPSLLRRDQSVSRGTVLAAGLVSLHGGQAQTAIAVDASVTARSTGETVSHYRMLLRLADVGGRWLVSDVSFVGLPM
jgi:Mce-associated membrane protein